MQKVCAFLIIFLLFLTGSGSFAIAQTTPRDPANTPATFHMTGSTELLSHYVERGVSQSNKSPALQGSFWFNFGPQARLGVWGSSVDFENDSANFLLKPSADVAINISNNVDITFGYSENKHYNTSNRDGNTVGFYIGLFGYRVKYELLSNWEGTSTRASYFSLGKTFDFGEWKSDNEFGYSMLQAQGFNNYFDIRTMIGRNLGRILAQAGLTGTSSNSQFGSAGGYFLILRISTTF